MCSIVCVVERGGNGLWPRRDGESPGGCCSSSRQGRAWSPPGCPLPGPGSPARVPCHHPRLALGERPRAEPRRTDTGPSGRSRHVTAPKQRWAAGGSEPGRGAGAARVRSAPGAPMPALVRALPGSRRLGRRPRSSDRLGSAPALSFDTHGPAWALAAAEATPPPPPTYGEGHSSARPGRGAAPGPGPRLAGGPGAHVSSRPGRLGAAPLQAAERESSGCSSSSPPPRQGQGQGSASPGPSASGCCPGEPSAWCGHSASAGSEPPA